MMDEEELRNYEAVVNVRETGDSRMIIDEIFCLLLLQKLPILLAPLSFYPLHGLSTQKSSKQANRNAKAAIVRHDNKNDMGIPNLLLFQVGTH